jgi:hypothetical protein
MRFKRFLALMALLVLTAQQAAFATTAPASGHISDNARTQGEVKTDLEAIVSVIKELPGGNAEYPVTLSSDAFTPPADYGSCVITAESGTTDNLQSIAPTNVPNGRIICIRPASGHTITVKNGSSANYIATHTGSDVVLSSVKQYMLLKFDSTASPDIWNVVAMNYGDQTTAARTAIGAAASGANSDITSLSALSPALSIAQGGHNNAALAATAGGMLYTDGSKLVNMGAGTAGQVPVSNGASAPTWGSAGGAIAQVCGGRLTLTSGTAVTTSNVTGATSIYLTPTGGQIGLYNGSTWSLNSFTELTFALGTLTADTLYDLFAWNNGGTITLSRGPAWSSATTRGTGAGTTELELVNGVYVNKVSIAGGPGAQTGRYVGTFRTTSTTTTEDSSTKRFLYNAQNRKLRSLAANGETTNSWSYSTETWRVANGAAVAYGTNAFGVVRGLDEDPVEALAMHRALIGGNHYAATGIGIDSSTVNSAQISQGGFSDNRDSSVSGRYIGYPGIGFREFRWLEIASSATFYGDIGKTYIQTGMIGETMQ